MGKGGGVKLLGGGWREGEEDNQSCSGFAKVVEGGGGGVGRGRGVGVAGREVEKE